MHIAHNNVCRSTCDAPIPLQCHTGQGFSCHTDASHHHHTLLPLLLNRLPLLPLVCSAHQTQGTQTSKPQQRKLYAKLYAPHPLLRCSTASTAVTLLLACPTAAGCLFMQGLHRRGGVYAESRTCRSCHSSTMGTTVMAVLNVPCCCCCAIISSRQVV